VKGKTVVITGPTSGIGLETARGIARLGAHLVLVARDRARAENVAREATSLGAEAADVVVADFTSLASVREAAASIDGRYPFVDVLVNNAGAIYMERAVTKDGFEATMGVNHLAPFLLTEKLRPALERAPAARVVNVSSDAHKGGSIPWDDFMSERGYSGFPIYCASKLANILFTRELARRLDGTRVTTNALHPGLVASGFGHNNSGLLGMLVKVGAPFMVSAANGAKTSIHLATSPEVARESGFYFVKCRKKEPSSKARDAESARRLWDLSVSLVGS
jgi:retinol dehydrogenase 12